MGIVFIFSLFTSITYLTDKLYGAKSLQAQASKAPIASPGGSQPLDGICDTVIIQNRSSSPFPY